jgi:hypothetical protein
MPTTALPAEEIKNQEIALKIHMSEYTNRGYLLWIFDKSGISSGVELVVLYTFNGIEGVATPAPFSATPASLQGWATEWFPLVSNAGSFSGARKQDHLRVEEGVVGDGHRSGEPTL